MSSIFRKDDNYVDKPNRNTFDLSWQNNLSLKFGKLVPCFCQEVIPGDSFKIQPTFGLRFLPQVFPVQTRMRAHLHYFYVRNRTLWKDWMDFIGKTKQGLVVPYLKSSQNFNAEPEESLKESSIYDYMGLPVVLDSEVNPVERRVFSSRGVVKHKLFRPQSVSDLPNTNASSINIPYSNLLNNNAVFQDVFNSSSVSLYREFVKPIVVYDFNSKNSFPPTFEVSFAGSNVSDYVIFLYCEFTNRENTNKISNGYVRLNATNLTSEVINTAISVWDGTNNVSCRITRVFGWFAVSKSESVSVTPAYEFLLSVTVHPSLNQNYPFAGLTTSSLPYGDSPDQFRINALPFRAYEAIYNSFYRNPENNPFKISGVPEYNKYVTSDEGGAQYFSSFQLYDRNWEDDAFTTAVPTPQQGDAPRVGLTGNPNEPVKLFYSNEDGSVGHLTLNVDSNGRVTMLRDANGETTNEGLVNAINDAVNFGITINDLRNVNALQLWLEKNVRKGYKYRDQLMSHYGVKISYNDLLMPEFIGGVSRDVTVNQISQTVETDTGNLGDMAGQAYVVGEGNSVTHFCDEHGYIIGILSVVPVPNYSQMIPKHFFKHDTFDYFFPEFGKIGMQPITNKEIAATASWLTNKGDDTFGYQRAWYDYLANVDQVHGKFNSEFYNFLIQRKFGNVPELGADFTTVKNEDLNNIFYTDSDDDKILGQIYFDVKAIRPIPLFGIPSLE